MNGPATRYNPPKVEALERRTLLSGNGWEQKLALLDTGPTGSAISAITLDSSGNEYAATSLGGAYGAGAVVMIPANSSAASVLYSTPVVTTSGAGSITGLIADGSGNLFGLSSNGLAHGFGGLFKINSSGTFSTLSAFNSALSGNSPGGKLAIDGAGNIYFTTTLDNLLPQAQVWKWSASQSTLSLVASLPLNATESSRGVVIDGDRNLYVELQGLGGTSVYKIAAGSAVGIYSGSATLLASSIALTDVNPFSTMTVDSSGNLYGVGGIESQVWELASGGGSFSTLATLSGASPTGAVAVDSSGDVFGSAASGGAYGAGTIFEIAQNSGTAAIVGTIPSTSFSPVTGELMDASGNLWSGSELGTYELSPAALKLVFTSAPTSTIAGIPQQVVVKLEDAGSGNVITSDSFSTVLLSLNAVNGSPAASPSGTDTARFDNGVATFSALDLTTAGTYTMTASDALYNPATSAQFTVSDNQVASRLAIVSQPVSAIAGTADLPIVVEVTDSYGNVITNDSSNVTISLQSGAGVLAGTLTRAAVNGIATFAPEASTAGTYVVKAVDGILTPVLTANMTVLPASPHQLAIISQPRQAIAGANFSPIQVAIEDAFGNVVTSAQSVISLSIDSGPTDAMLRGTVSESASQGEAEFSELWAAIAGAYTLTAGDSNLDPGSTSTITVAPGAASALAILQPPASTTAGSTLSPLGVAVVDAWDNPITGDASQVSLSVQSGPGALSGNTTQTLGSGAASFSDLELDRAGNYILKASDAADGFSATTPGFTISPGAAAGLSISQQPTTATVGQSFAPILVQVLDNLGNVVAGNTSTVTLSLITSPDGASVSGPLTASVANGTATFSGLSTTVAGNYQFQATDDVLSSIDSGLIAVAAAATENLHLGTQPPDATAGTTLSPIAVTLLDQYGNLAASSHANLSIAVSQGPGQLTGTTTVTPSSGVATFSNLELTKAGSYQLTITDQNNGQSITTSSFSINPGAASSLGVIEQPTSETAGATWDTLEVQIQDAFGNLVAAASGSVSVSILSGPANATLGGNTTRSTVNGVATFHRLSATTAGNYLLQVVDGLLTTATSSITIEPGPAVDMTIDAEPANAVAGTTLSAYTVTLLDQYGNVATGEASSVQVSIAGGPDGAVLEGTTSRQPTTGVVSFTGLSAGTLGTYTLEATLPNGTNEVTDPFNVTGGFVNPPTQVGAGSAPGLISIQLRDSLGNILAADGSTVRLALTRNGNQLRTASEKVYNGIATFKWRKFYKTGIYQWSVSGGPKNALIGATTVEVTSGLANKIALVRPIGSIASGSGFSVAAKLIDKYGNNVNGPDVSAAISLVKSGSSGALSGTQTVPIVNGVANFNALTISQAGSYRLEIVSAGKQFLTPMFDVA